MSHEKEDAFSVVFQLFPEGWVGRMTHWAQPANVHWHRGQGQESETQSCELTTSSSAHHTDVQWLPVCGMWLFVPGEQGSPPERQ